MLDRVAQVYEQTAAEVAELSEELAVAVANLTDLGYALLYDLIAAGLTAESGVGPIAFGALSGVTVFELVECGKNAKSLVEAAMAAVHAIRVASTAAGTDLGGRLTSGGSALPARPADLLLPRPRSDGSVLSGQNWRRARAAR